MAAKVVAFVALCCFIKAISCDTVGGVINEYRPKIRALGEKAYSVAHQSADVYGNAKSSTENWKRDGTRTVAERLGSLKAYVGKTVGDAASANKDIRHCVDAYQKAIQPINENDTQKCSANAELNSAQNHVQALREIQRPIYQIPEDCKRKFPSDSQTASLRKCFDERIAGVEKELVERSGQVEALSKTARDKVKTCVDALVKDYLDRLEKITEEFKSCVAKAWGGKP